MGYQGPKVINQTSLDHYKLTFDHSSGLIELPVTTKSASYQVLLTDSGHVFTSYGGSAAVTFTLPTTLKKGAHFRFINLVDQNMIVAGAANTVITFNDLTATSVAAQTTSEKIGAVIDAFCDGNAWHLAGVAVGHTYTVA